MSSTVPKIIHQMWCGVLPRPDRWMEQWKMPGWEYRLWTEKEIDARSWGRAFDFFRGFDYWPGVKDAVEIGVLSEFGGVFVDADSAPLRPWGDPPFLASSGFAARTGPHPGEPNRLGVGTVGAAPGSPVILRWGEIVEGLPEFLESWQTVVPALAQAYCELLDPTFLMLPQGVFYPVGLRGTDRDDTVEHYAEHYWATTRKLY